MSTEAAVLLLALLSVVLVMIAAWLLIGTRRSLEERERIRRHRIAVQGRVTDGEVLDFHDNSLSYSYQVAGVVYQATQEVGALRTLLPTDPALLVGPAHVKYLIRNPANSILIGERWSGLRLARPANNEP